MGNEFSKDGGATKFFEELPIVGYIPAAIHGIAGNKDEAIRAAGKSTGAVLTVGGAVIGGIVGGPVGAMAGGAAGGAVGEVIKDGITGERVHFNDVVIATGLGGIGGAFGGVGKLVALEGFGASLTKATLVGIAGSQTITKVFIGIPKNLTTEKVGDDGEQFVAIKVKGTSLVVSLTNGKVVLENQNGGNNQQWRFKDAVFRSKGEESICLDVKGGAASECTPVKSHQINGGINQRWVYNKEKFIVQTASGGDNHYVLSVKGDDISAGCKLYVCKPHYGKNQQFEIEYVN